MKKAEELAIGAETRVTAPRKNSSEGVKLVLPEPNSFVDWDPRLPPPGNIVERQYKGKMIRVIVLQEGFEYEGRRYKSLTAIAKEVSRLHSSLTSVSCLCGAADKFECWIRSRISK